MSGRLFYVPPSKFEIEHYREIKELVAKAEMTGHLDSNPMTEMWERRNELNPLRFGFNHPNLRIFMNEFSIDRDSPYLHPPQPPVYVDPPVNPPDTGCTTCEPCPSPQIVPEPMAIFSMSTAVLIWFGVYLWLRKTARKSVGEV